MLTRCFSEVMLVLSGMDGVWFVKLGLPRRRVCSMPGGVAHAEAKLDIDVVKTAEV
jgi:hypothetical protein